jgi:NAD(P)-dependent dehydrogenase (short-subunit alcohol dehydrogenase family)
LQLALPTNPSSLVRWRQRIGQDGSELLLQATIAAAERGEAVKEQSLERISVDTTVQTKAIAHPLDSRLYHRRREMRTVRSLTPKSAATFGRGLFLIEHATNHQESTVRSRARILARESKTWCDDRHLLARRSAACKTVFDPNPEQGGSTNVVALRQTGRCAAGRLSSIRASGDAPPGCWNRIPRGALGYRGTPMRRQVYGYAGRRDQCGRVADSRSAHSGPSGSHAESEVHMEVAELDVVVVTGASAGVGRACARAFGERGAAVGLIARGRDGLEAARREIEAAGGRAIVLVADVVDADQVEAAAARVEAEFGPIDVWVNDAMVTIFGPVHATTPAEFRRATEVTYLGTVHGTMAALKRMRERDHGTIVQVGSALAYRSVPLQAPYCGAKAAIRAFTDSLRCELLHERSNVHLTMVQLSAFNTPQFDWAHCLMDRTPQPLPPIFQPEVAAEAIVWAAQRRRREVWVGWPAVKAILGNRVIPGLLDRMMARSGWDGQLTEEPAAANRPDNLYSPVPSDFGAHGRFSERARPRSWQFWLTRHATPTLAASAAAVLLVAAVIVVGLT